MYNFRKEHHKFLKIHKIILIKKNKNYFNFMMKFTKYLKMIKLIIKKNLKKKFKSVIL